MQRKKIIKYYSRSFCYVYVGTRDYSLNISNEGKGKHRRKM